MESRLAKGVDKVMDKVGTFSIGQTCPAFIIRKGMYKPSQGDNFFSQNRLGKPDFSAGRPLVRQVNSIAFMKP